MAKENRPTLRGRKGWIGFVRDYKKFTDTVDWDSMEWDKKSKCKSVEKDSMGKEIQKW